MNFALLKEIIVHLKRGFSCPECKRRYGNKAINVGAVKDGAVDLHLSCPRCSTVVVANVSLVDGKRKHRSVKVKANKYSSVSENDVLDVKNFLKGFEGSFKTLFQKK